MHLLLSRRREVGCVRLLCQSALIAVLLVLAACSTIKLAYRNVDLYLVWKADEYFSLDDPQAASLKAGLNATTAWHRSEELTRYSAVLLEARERVGRTISEDDIDWLLSSARKRYEALAGYAAPRAAQVLSSLSPAQIAHFEEALRRENEVFSAEYVDVSVEAQRRQRYDRTMDLVQEWIGPLSPVQRARIEQLSADIPLTYALRLQDRQRRQRALIELLTRPQTTESLTPELEAWMLKWDHGRSAEYEGLAQTVQQQTVVMVIELEHSLSPTQRAHVQARLERYARDFDSMASIPSGRAEAGSAIALLEPLVGR